MANTIQVKRGAKTNLPTLNQGEFGYCTDTNELFIGTGTSNKQVLVGAQIRLVEIHIDNGGSVLSEGLVDGFLEIPACTLLGYTLLADQSGSVELDIWKCTYANVPPTVADSILESGSTPPGISSGIKNQDSTLTNWDTDFDEGDIVVVSITSCTTITHCTLVLKLAV